MCLSSPDIPKADAPQEAKQPDFTALTKARKKASASAGGSLLTSPSGVDLSAQNTGAPSLLGS